MALVTGPSAALPDAVATTRTKDKVNVLIWNDFRITISKLFTVKANGKAAGMTITTELVCRKVCAKCVRKFPTLNSKQPKKSDCAELL